MAKKDSTLLRELEPSIAALIRKYAPGALGLATTAGRLNATAGSPTITSTGISYLRADGSTALTGNLAATNGVLIDGVDLSVLKTAFDTHAVATQKIATAGVLGHIRIGTGLTIDAATGIVTASAGGGGDVPSTRALTAGAGLTGGGDLTVDRTFNIGQGTLMLVTADAISLASGTAQYQVPVTGVTPFAPAYTLLSAFAGIGLSWNATTGKYDVTGTGGVGFVPESRLLTAGAGLTGGGDLTVDRTFNIGQGTLLTVAADSVGLANGTAEYQFISTGPTTFTPVYTLLSTLAGAGIAFAAGVLSIGQGTLLTVAADSVGLANGTAQYQVPVTGVTPFAPAYTLLSAFAGPGIAFTSGAFAIGQGLGLTVTADDIALTTPGTLTVASVNTSTGSHTHAITSSVSPGTTASLLATTAAGLLTLQSLTVTTAPIFTALTPKSVLYVGASDIISESSIFVWDYTNARLGVGTAGPTQQAHVLGNLRVQGGLYVDAGIETQIITSARELINLSGVLRSAAGFSIQPNGGTTAFLSMTVAGLVGVNIATAMSRFHVQHADGIYTGGGDTEALWVAGTTANKRVVVKYDTGANVAVVQAWNASGTGLNLNPSGGGIGVNIGTNPSYQIELGSTDAASSGLYITRPGSVVSIPNPGSTTNSVLLNARGLSLTDSSATLISVTSAFGIAVAGNQATPLLQLRNIGGPSARFFGDMGINIAGLPESTLHVVGSVKVDGGPFRLDYNDLSFGQWVVNSVGTVTQSSTSDIILQPSGDLVFNPTNNNVLPQNTFDIRMGSNQRKYLSLYAAELNVEQLVAQNTTATINGRILVGSTSILTRDLLAPLISPAVPTVITVGTAGVTTYSYRLVARDADGGTLASVAGQIGTGAAALTGVNFNRVSWLAVVGATSYGLYGRLAGSELLIVTTAALTYDDTGVVVPAGALPVSNTTVSKVYVKYNAFTANDIVYLESGGKVEFWKVLSYPVTISDATADTEYSYIVTRNFENTEPHLWYTGDAVFNTGQIGSGFVDIYSSLGLTASPLDYIFNYDTTNVAPYEAGTYTNNIATSEHWWLFGQVATTVNDSTYFGRAASTWQSLYFTVVEAAVWNLTAIWEYWNGAAWTTFTPITTGAITVAGALSIEWNTASLTGWAAKTINGRVGYWIRYRISSFTSLTTSPCFGLHQVTWRRRQHGPAIVMNVRKSQVFNDWTPRGAFGNLNGVFGYSSDTYGFAAGKYDPADLPTSTYITIDATSGLRVFNNNNIVGQWDTTGIVTIGRATATKSYITIDDTNGIRILSSTVQVGRWYTTGNLSIGQEAGSHIFASGTTLEFRTGATAYTTLSGGSLLLGRVGLNQSNVYISSGVLQLRNDTTVYTELTTTGVVTIGRAGVVNQSHVYISAGAVQLRSGVANTVKLELTSAGNLNLAGDITMQTGGEIKAGQASLNTGTGVYLSAAGTMSVGVGSAGVLTKGMSWDGTTFLIQSASFMLTPTTVQIGASTGTLGNLLLSGGELAIRAGTVTKISMTAAGNLTLSGNLDMLAGGDIRAGATGLWLGNGYYLSNTAGVSKIRVGTVSGTGVAGTLTKGFYFDGADYVIKAADFELDALGRITAANATLVAATITTASITGATFTGDVVFNKGVLDTFLQIRGAAASNRGLLFQTGTAARWLVYVNDTAEAGLDAGSDMAFISYTDAGVIKDIPLIIARSTGDAYFAKNIFAFNIGVTPAIDRIPKSLGTGYIADGWLSTNIARLASGNTWLGGQNFQVNVNLPGQPITIENINAGISAYTVAAAYHQGMDINLIVFGPNYTVGAFASTAELYTGQSAHLNIRNGAVGGDIRLMIGTTAKLVVASSGDATFANALSIVGNVSAANISATSAASIIPQADASGKLADAFLSTNVTLYSAIAPTFTGPLAASNISVTSTANFIPKADASGDISDAWLTTNVPLKNTANIFTSDQTIQRASGNGFFSVYGPAATSRGLILGTVATLRWLLYTTAAAESGLNAGSDFALTRYNDAGTPLGTPIAISRATGDVTLANSLSAANITAIPGASMIPKAEVGGKLADGWLSSNVPLYNAASPTFAGALSAASAVFAGAVSTGALTATTGTFSGNIAALNIGATAAANRIAQAGAGATLEDAWLTSNIPRLNAANLFLEKITTSKSLNSLHLGVEAENTSVATGSLAGIGATSQGITALLYAIPANYVAAIFQSSVQFLSATAAHVDIRNATVGGDIRLMIGSVVKATMANTGNTTFVNDIAAANIGATAAANRIAQAGAGGTLADAWLSTNVPLKASANIFQAQQTVDMGVVAAGTTGLQVQADASAAGNIGIRIINTDTTGSAFLALSDVAAGTNRFFVLRYGDTHLTLPYQVHLTNQDAGDMVFSTNNAERLRLLVAGGVRATAILSVSGAAATNRDFEWETAGLTRWMMRAGSGLEAGANAGSDMTFERFDDAGAFLGYVYQVQRSTGNINIGAGTSAAFKLNVTGTFNATGDLSGGNITATPSASKIPLADVGGKLADGWLSSNVPLKNVAAIFGDPLNVDVGTVAATTTLLQGKGSLAAATLMFRIVNTSASGIAALAFSDNPTVNTSNNFSVLSYNGVHATLPGAVHLNNVLAGDMWFSTNNAERLRLLAAGGARIASLLDISGAVATNRDMAWQTSALDRFAMRTGSGLEAGANAGSDFTFEHYADAGTFVGYVFQVQRSTGNINIGAGTASAYKLQVTGTLHATGSLSGGGTAAFSGALSATAAAFSGNLSAANVSAVAGANVIAQAGAGGTLADAWHSANVPLKNVANVFTASGQAVRTVTGDAYLSVGGAAGFNRGYLLDTAGLNRWVLRMSNGAEAGAQAGSDFQIARYSDLGAEVGIALTLNRATAAATFGGALAASNISAVSGANVIAQAGAGGTLADTFLSANVPRLNVAAAFTANLSTSLLMGVGQAAVAAKQLAVLSTAIGNVGAEIKGMAGQTADLGRFWTSANLGISIDKAGNLASNTAAPTIAAGLGAGTTPTVSVIAPSSNMGGKIRILTGTAPPVSATVATITFSGGGWTAAPKAVILHDANAAAANMTASVFVSAVALTTFTVTVGAVALTAATTYDFWYEVVG